MRQIKFRAWTGELMVDLYKVTPFALTEGMGDGLFLPFDKKYLLMQFTGLLDKNGTEIYEGDILCIPEYTPRDDGNCDDEAVEVYFDDGRLIWAFRFGSYGFDYLTEAEGATIIGNVHENPELLTKG